jgi:hypothetical protein
MIFHLFFLIFPRATCRLFFFFFFGFLACFSCIAILYAYQQPARIYIEHYIFHPTPTSLSFWCFHSLGLSPFVLGSCFVTFRCIPCFSVSRDSFGQKCPFLFSSSVPSLPALIAARISYISTHCPSAHNFHSFFCLIHIARSYFAYCLPLVFKRL